MFQIKFSILRIHRVLSGGYNFGSYPLRMDYRTKPHISSNRRLNIPMYFAEIFHFEVHFFPKMFLEIFVSFNPLFFLDNKAQHIAANTITVEKVKKVKLSLCN
jgi:hypothetical protein